MKRVQYTINLQKSVAFLYTNNELAEREIKKNNPIYDHNKMKTTSMNKFSKEVKDLYNGNYNILMK